MEGPAQDRTVALHPADLAGALGWWRDAGVDLDFHDDPQAWLAAPEPAADGPAPGRYAPAARPKSAAEPEPVARIGGDPALWPRDLAGFRQWWLAEPSLDHGIREGRVAPRGPAGAALMVLVGQPEVADGERLLGGAEGRLLDAMLRAMGLAPEAVYLAAALPRHTPAADWADLDWRGLGAVVRHHIALVRPQRLLVFGSGVLSLLGNDPAQSAQNSSQFYHEGQSIALLGARDLGLLSRPAWKARFWHDWLDWTGTTSQ